MSHTRARFHGAVFDRGSLRSASFVDEAEKLTHRDLGFALNWGIRSSFEESAKHIAGRGTFSSRNLTRDVENAVGHAHSECNCSVGVGHIAEIHAFGIFHQRRCVVVALSRPLPEPAEEVFVGKRAWLVDLFIDGLRTQGAG